MIPHFIVFIQLNFTYILLFIKFTSFYLLISHYISHFLHICSFCPRNLFVTFVNII